jgi:DNA-directed RNA polymerase III subunit RPC1
MKKECVAASAAPRKISKIQFGALSTNEIQKVAEVQVNSRDLYAMPQRRVAPNGCLDPHLGISDKASSCLTCNKKLADCAGHFGYVQLELPLFHAGYFRHTLTILQCICKRCSRILLPPAERQDFLKKMRNPKIDALQRSSIFKKIVDTCKHGSMCPYCRYPNGVVKKLTGGFFKIVHEKFRAKNNQDDNDIHQNVQSTVFKQNQDLKSLGIKDTELLNPMRAFELFRMMSEEDMTLLWMNGDHCRPECLISWTIPVPPVPIRPSVAMDIGGGSNEDDLTVKLQEIIDVNNALTVALDNGATMKMIQEDWEFLQIQAAQFINGEVPGVPRSLAGTKAIRGLCQRLKGKQGRFRGNLSGKRVDFSARTVISPDPNLRIEQVGVPIHVAKIMTFPEKVNRYNIELLKKCVVNGPDIHPGANFIRDPLGVVRSLAYGDRKRTAESIKIGDTVERHMHDGDVVLFNRQPSLHKMSIMAHRVKVLPWRTFRFNECACTPYNADFDGDEMNMHLPQTEEAKAEAAELMAISNNLITPRNGEPLVAATQDFLTGAHLLTRKDVFLDREEFMQLIAHFSDADEHIDLPEPAIYKPHKLWTGKQVMSLMVRPNKESECLVNVESMERFYTKDKFFCEEDGFVCFQNGELICGNLGKKTLGGDSKMGLFYVLIRDYGALEATRSMSRLAKLCARYLGDRGFSIGIDDVTPSVELNAMKQNILTSGQSDAIEQIALYKAGKIKLKPGCDELQSLESEVNGILGRIRERAGKESIRVLHHTNAPHTMAQCGSKGSTLNISQMIACLGQQSVGGSRIQDGFVNRTLPHFPLGALEPAAKGFVANSFFSGLTATEFFFHTMGGREGLVDTAVKTAETGYMARRLMKALEDLSMQYDNTVRNSEQTVVQFTYGDDGLNPQLMEGGDRPVDYERLLKNNCQQMVGAELSASSEQIRALVDGRLEEKVFQRLLPEGRLFLDETKQFFEDIAVILDGIEAMDKQSAKAKAVTAAGFGSLRERLSKMTSTEKLKWRTKAAQPKTKEQAEAVYLLKDNVLRITPSQIHAILTAALKKYNRSVIEPGEAVGAVGAQSISEPGTQMTLKTFHFAGVASMNVTLGVPRLKEIINASKLISTPIITANLIQNDNRTSARLVKGRIEKTMLGEVCEYIREVHTPEMSYVSIRLDMEIIRKLHLNIDANTVRWSILHLVGTHRSPVLRSLKEKHVIVMPPNDGTSYCRLRVLSPDSKDNGKGIPAHQRTYFNLQALKSSLPVVIVEGIPTVHRAVINEEEVPVEGDTTGATKTRYYLLVEGYGMQEVMCSPGVDGRDTKSNHIIEVQQVLGIEAARSAIAAEISYIMAAYGITVDRRHLMLLSDVMTFKGEILGITRFGVAKMRESVLMLASFEKTSDHLFDAAVHSREDSIVGVSECIIMGVPIPIGTGLFKVIQKQKSSVKIETKKRLLG